MLSAGRLDRRVTIETPTDGVDGSGAPSATWAALATVWADVRPISGREFVAAGQTAAEATTRITIRWRADITTRHRIVHGATIYSIEHVAEIGRREGLDLMCRAEAA